VDRLCRRRLWCLSDPENRLNKTLQPQGDEQADLEATFPVRLLLLKHFAGNFRCAPIGKKIFTVFVVFLEAVRLVMNVDTVAVLIHGI
jgi:hypothetical protein